MYNYIIYSNNYINKIIITLVLMLEPCSPVQGFGIWRRGVEVCGCGVVAAMTLILLVRCTVYVKFIK